MSPGKYVRFVLAFTVLYLLLRFTLGLFLQYPTAYLVSLLTGCEWEGVSVVCGYVEYRIVPECTGVVSFALLLALLSAAPISRERKVRAIVFGIPFLYVLNVLRVYALVSLSRSLFAFDLLHVAFWLASPLFVVLYVVWLMK